MAILKAVILSVQVFFEVTSSIEVDASFAMVLSSVTPRDKAFLIIVKKSDGRYGSTIGKSDRKRRFPDVSGSFKRFLSIKSELVVFVEHQ